MTGHPHCSFSAAVRPPTGPNEAISDIAAAEICWPHRKIFEVRDGEGEIPKGEVAACRSGTGESTLGVEWRSMRVPSGLSPNLKPWSHGNWVGGKRTPPSVDSFHLMVAPKGARYESIPLALAVRTWKSSEGWSEWIFWIGHMPYAQLGSGFESRQVFGGCTYKLQACADSGQFVI